MATDFAGTADKIPSTVTVQAALDIRRNPPIYLSIAEAAVYLDLCERTVRNLIKSRTLPSTNLGGRILLKTAAVDAALEKLQVAAV